MAAGDHSPESFASLYLKGKKQGRRAKPPVQADLFSGAMPAAPPEPGLRPTLVPPVAVVDRPAPRLWTVRELVGQIRQQVESVHFSVWVEGEVSNCRPSGSGHLYFTLRDGEAQLPVVLFRRQAQLLAAKPKDGDAVEVRGRLSVYESRGQLQLIGETLELRGAGALELAFKRLKAKLLAEGLFAEERKRPLPAFPRCLGIVTSPHGAVIRDILHVVRRRHSCLNLLVYPAAMQGAGCARGVAEGIRWFNRNPGRVDLIILARGGGSIEDLAGFNDEALARAIAASELPVVSAIGHETDFTIADFVADLRAPTPSAAAELVTAAQHRIEERVWALEQRVQRAGRYQLMAARQRLTRLSADAALLRLRDAVSRRDQRLDELRLRLGAGADRRLRARAQAHARMLDRLRQQDPAQRLASARLRLKAAGETLGRLRKGMLLTATRRLESAAAGLNAALPTSALRARLERARARLVAPGAPVAARRRLEGATGRLLSVSLTGTRGRRLDRAAARLEALSPLAVLSRGYALVYAPDGSLVRNAAEVKVGETIRARLAAGTLVATVEDVTG